MQRWHVIQQRVGWLGVFLGHAFKSDLINSGSERTFKELVEILVRERHVMADIMVLAWPDAPLVVLSVGGTVF